MDLVKAYAGVRKAIVAFAPKCVPKTPGAARKPPFPPIIGTGFIVHPDGLVATNDHVVQAFSEVYRPPDMPPDDWGVFAMLFELRPEGQLDIHFEIAAIVEVGHFEGGKHYYGPRRPDIALVQVKGRGLPSLDIDSDSRVREGLELATAGFPMGAEALMAPGWLQQITPTLQRGIVSAVLPFPCDTYHAFTVNIMAQGGASGSPVFHPETGKVLGVLYAGLEEQQSAGPLIYHRPTNISYVVPSHYLRTALEQENKERQSELPHPKAKTIDEILEGAEIVSVFDSEDADLHRESSLHAPRRELRITRKPRHR